MPTGNAPTTRATIVVVPLRSVRLHGAAGCAGGGNGLATPGRQTTSLPVIPSPNFVRHTVRATSQGRTENDGGVLSGGVLGIFPWKIPQESVENQTDIVWRFQMRLVSKVIAFPIAVLWVFRWQILAIAGVVLGIRWWDRLTF